MINRKGDLRDAIVGVVIAVLGIIIFGGAVILLYQATGDQDVKNAEELEEIFLEKINALEEGDGDISVRGVEGWSFIGWSKNHNSKPDKCFFESCLCVCPGGKPEFFGDNVDYFKNSCQERGFCSEKLDRDNLFLASGILILQSREFPEQMENQNREKPDGFLAFIDSKLYRVGIVKNE